MAGGSKKLTKQEELLLQDFSRNVSTKSSALFYGNAFIVSAIPICKFCNAFNRYAGFSHVLPVGVSLVDKHACGLATWHPVALTTATRLDWHCHCV